MTGYELPAEELSRTSVTGQRKRPVSAVAAVATHSGASTPVAGRLLVLQRAAGNRAVSRLLRLQREVDESPINRGTATEALGPFITKKADERQALDQWNLAASGRNQGLIHVVDYARARPAQVVSEKPRDVDNAEWRQFLAGHPLSGTKLVTLYGEDDKWLAGFSKKLENLFPASELFQKAQLKKNQVNQIMRDASNKREAAASPEVVSLKKDAADLDAAFLRESRWVIPRDDSKKGRVEQVGEALAKTGATADFTGTAIVGVTEALGKLVTDKNTEQRHAKGWGEPLTSHDEWVKSSAATEPTKEHPGGQRARWEQKDVTFTGSAEEEESTPAGLRVVKWGPPGKVKYSTVMGGSK